MAEWTPEHPVDATLAERLVHAQFPALRDRRAAHVGVGFDNVVWRFGDLGFRFPQRAAAVPLITVELRVLPQLRLPLAIPTPTHVGRPSDAFPHPFYGAPLVPGDASDPGPGDGARLGAFLRALHGSAPDGVPDDTYKSDPASRLEKTLARLPGLAGTAWDVAWIRDALHAPLPPPPPWVTCHGDLYARHILVHEGRVSGVIDWGDLRRGNPGMDLNVVYAVLPAGERAAFWDAYGRDTPELRAWARFYALNYGVLLTTYGLAEGRVEFVRIGERALEAVGM